MAIQIMFHEGFAVDSRIFFYFNEKLPCMAGRIRAIHRLENNHVVYMVSTEAGIVCVPHCDMFKDRDMCMAYAESPFAKCAEHSKLVQKATLFGIGVAPNLPLRVIHSMEGSEA